MNSSAVQRTTNGSNKLKRSALRTLDSNQRHASFFRSTSAMSLVSMCSDASSDERRYSSPLKKLRSKPPAAGLSKTTTTPPPNLEQNFVKQANQGLRRYSNPSLTPEGTGGAYIIRSSSGRNLAVYKPSEEEAFAPNNHIFLKDNPTTKKIVIPHLVIFGI